VTGTLPPSWNQADAFPSMQFFEMEDCQLTGTLPANWSPSLQFLDVAGNDFNGTLPAELGSLMQLQQLTLNANPFTGQLPAAWGEPGAFPELFALECYDTNIDGTLPDAWGSIQAFQELQTFTATILPVRCQTPGHRRDPFPLCWGWQSGIHFLQAPYQ